MNTSKSLDSILNALFNAGINYGTTGKASTDPDQAKTAIVEAVEGIYGDSDGLREFASTGSNQVVTPSVLTDGCPCLLVEPCSYACSCANSIMSGGCLRCAKYGSMEQRIAAAKRLAQCTDLVATDKEARNG